MEFIEQDHKLIIKIECDGERQSLQEIFESGEIDSDNARFDFFDNILHHNGWEWIRPEDISALTDAPILGIVGENDEVEVAYGWMDYAVTSLLSQLHQYGEATLIGG